jgi:hypothetical protein
VGKLGRHSFQRGRGREKKREREKNVRFFEMAKSHTCNSLMATQEFAGKPCSIGTRNWRHPDQCPISNMMQIRLKIRMKTPSELRN